MKKKKNWIPVVIFLVMLVGYCAISYEPPGETLEEELAELALTPTAIPLTEQLGITIDAEAFVENWGKTELPPELETLGLSNLKDVDVVGNGMMKIIRAKTNDSRALDVTVTLENDVPIYVMISGIPTTKTKVKIGIFGRLKTETKSDVASVDMFSDTEGGYLAVYDSAAGTITDYETGDIIVKWE